MILENDPSPLVRSTAAEALNGHLTDDALIALSHALKDDCRLVRVRAAESMASVPPKQLQVVVDSSLVINNLRMDFERAMTELINGMTVRPDHYASHYNLGNIYMGQGKIDKALASFRTAIKLRPDFIPPYVNIAFVYNAKGQNQRAEQSFREALNREPGNVLALTNLALLLGEMGRRTEAESTFRRLLKIDPNSATAAFNLAVILADQQPKESLEFSKKALSLQPDNQQYAYTFAFYLHKSGKTNKAVEVLQIMLDQQTPYAGAYFLIGQIFEQQGKKNAAIEVYMNASRNMKLSESQRNLFYSRAKQIR